jgi:hypothetical protein
VTWVFTLLGRRPEIEWECNNGGQLWPGVNPQVAATNTVALPSAFCSAGFASLSTAFTVALLIDLFFQVCGCERSSCGLIVDGVVSDLHVLPDVEIHEAVGALPRYEGAILWW